MRERREVALELGLDVDFAEKVFQDIHAHSVDLQDSELSVRSLNQTFHLFFIFRL
jgi:hypothetical protein